METEDLKKNIQAKAIPINEQCWALDWGKGAGYSIMDKTDGSIIGNLNFREGKDEHDYYPYCPDSLLKAWLIRKNIVSAHTLDEKIMFRGIDQLAMIIRGPVAPAKGRLQEDREKAFDRAAYLVYQERVRQEKKWGKQIHPDIYWLGILMEEVGEAAKDIIEFGITHNDQEKILKEVVQCAAVCYAWLENMEGRPISGTIEQSDEEDME